MYTDRIEYYKALEKKQNSKIIAYVTSDRKGLESSINPDILNFVTDHLDKIGNTEKISLVLNSNGGNPNAGWDLVNLIRQYCTKFEVIIPAKALSTATIISIGADNIIMTKQAVIAPIDPKTNSCLNPNVPGTDPEVTTPIYVKDVAAYLDLAKKKADLTDQGALSQAFQRLTEEVHPIVLGASIRLGENIQEMVRKMLRFHMNDEETISKIVRILCDESGYDCTINSVIAKNELHLPVEEPDEELYSIIKKLYSDVRNELKLDSIFDHHFLMSDTDETKYSEIKSFIESVDGGTDQFCTKGVIKRYWYETSDGPQERIYDNRNEEWVHTEL